MADELTINLNNDDITVPQWAKEETMVQIKDLLAGKGVGKDSLAKGLAEGGKAAKGFDKSLKSAIPGPIKMASAAGDAASALLGFGTTVLKTALTTTGNLSDLNAVIDAGVDVFDETIGKIPILGNVLSYFAKQAAEAAKTVNEVFDAVAIPFEDLSKIGAGFNGNLVEFGRRASDAYLELDVLADITNQNAEVFRSFGGTTQQGVDRFINLNKRILESGMNFRTLGLGLKDVAALNAEILDINSRNRDFRRLSDQEQADAVQNQIMQFAALSKITGKRADQIAEEVKAMTRRGNAAAALAMLDAEATQNYAALQAELAQFGPNVQQAAEDVLTLGTPIEEAATTLAAAGIDIGEFANLVEGAKTMSPEEFGNNIGKATDLVGNALNTEASLQVATLSRVSTAGGLVAEAFEEAAPLLAGLTEEGGGLDRFQKALNEIADQMAPEETTAKVLEQRDKLERLKFETIEMFLQKVADPGGLNDMIDAMLEFQIDTVDGLRKLMGLPSMREMMEDAGAAAMAQQTGSGNPGGTFENLMGKNVGQAFDMGLIDQGVVSARQYASASAMLTDPSVILDRYSGDERLAKGEMARLENRVRDEIERASTSDRQKGLSQEDIDNKLIEALESVEKQFNVQLKKTNRLLSDLGVTVR